MNNSSIGIVTAKETNDNGNLKLRIDKDWYYAGKCDVSGISVGKRITFEWNTFGNNPERPLKGIQSWGFTPDQPTPQEAEAATAAASAPRGGGKGGWKGGGGKGTDRSLEIDLQCMRFVGQIVGGLVEKGYITNAPDEHLAGRLARAAKAAWDAISFTRALGGSAPASADTPLKQATAGTTPQQAPQGGAPPKAASEPAPRPTGLFGYGTKFKDTPWNVMEGKRLQWFRDSPDSRAPADIRAKCDAELKAREEELRKAESYAQQDSQDFDDDIPF